MTDPEVTTGFRVSGRVQGVGFRWWTRRQAQELGLRGNVRNLPDGTVEVRASGPASAVGALRARLRQGAPGAYVEDVEEFASTEPPLPADGFHIVH